MSAVEKFVEKFVASLDDQPLSVDRLVTQPSDLSPEEMMTALSHPAVGRAGIDLMAASAKCGSSLTAPDIMKYKMRDL